MPMGYGLVSRTARTLRPVAVVVPAMRSTMTWWLVSRLPRRFRVIWENSRCSILFHLLVPGGRWATVTDCAPDQGVAAAKLRSSTLPDSESVGFYAAWFGHQRFIGIPSQTFLKTGIHLGTRGRRVGARCAAASIRRVNAGPMALRS